LRTDVRLNTVSGDIMVDGLVGDVDLNAVSGDVQVRELDGALSANSVSGDVAATGRITKASIDTVSGAMLVDSSGTTQSISLNSVSGTATVRLDRSLPANYVSRSVSGRVQIDGQVRSGKGPTNYTGSTGALAGSFVDVRANTVSGEITVLRRGISGLRPEELAGEEEW
jgi:DUF4097 and DUF4098 domain-containing protein YvlB